MEYKLMCEICLRHKQMERASFMYFKKINIKKFGCFWNSPEGKISRKISQIKHTWLGCTHCTDRYVMNQTNVYKPILKI